jgi:hypothetical protein
VERDDRTQDDEAQQQQAAEDSELTDQDLDTVAGGNANSQKGLGTHNTG